MFTVDETASPWTWVFDVYHPVDKTLYDYTFPSNLVGVLPPIDRTPVFRGTCDKQGAIYFNADGTPWCIEPETVLLVSYRFDFNTNTANAAVVLDGITGRVTIQ